MQPVVLRAMRMMERRMGEPLEVGALAKDLGITPRHLHRLFLEHTGETPAAFLRRIRMNEAAYRLRWSEERTQSLASALGFRSRPAFVRAFEARFGLPPAKFRKSLPTCARTLGKHASSSVFLEELNSMQLLARRYVGDIYALRENWKDFCARLPKAVIGAGPKIYVGLIHDDPRVAPDGKVRYDCGVALNADFSKHKKLFSERGLSLTEVASGTYAGIRHRGHYDTVPLTYDLVCQKWIVPNGRVPGTGPAIEVYTVPRHRQNPHDLEFTILIPLE